MKAPARLGGAVPPVPARSSARPHRWRRVLLRTIGVVIAVLALLAAMALLDQAEGDLRQVLAPALVPLATALA
ncbi:hypothetical protein [Roseateles sp.]|uniref:hypothetical protein n=1 Tax=Roseateles sp. TaxID=1971397 RepID=UPI0031DE894C